MPVYTYRCASCQTPFEKFKRVVDYLEPEFHCEQRAIKTLTPALLMTDLPGYTSPVDGRWVEGRAARREDLKRNGCREYDPSERVNFIKDRELAEEKFDREVDATLDAQIATMPARKLELLEQEVRSGVTAVTTREVANGT